MLAFGLCLFLLCYFTLVGSAVVRPLHATRYVVQDWLLSPIFGVVVTLLPVFFINRVFGLPLQRFGFVLMLVLVAMAAVAHWLRLRRSSWVRGRESAVGGPDSIFSLGPPTLPDGRAIAPDSILGVVLACLPFAFILLLATVLTGRPMFTYGFDWLSFCNDDMGNYCLAADRFLRHGFLDTPTSQELVSGVEYAQTYWFFHVPSMVRAGSELMIAWTCSIVGVRTPISSHQAFMPLIVSFHVSLVSAATALICSSPARRKASMIACVLLAGSAEMTFGTVYQLIAQAAGLAVLAANVSLILRPFRDLPTGRLVRHAALVGVGLTGQMLIYPEVNPFLGIGFALWVMFMVARRSWAFLRRRQQAATPAIPVAQELSTDREAAVPSADLADGEMLPVAPAADLAPPPPPIAWGRLISVLVLSGLFAAIFLNSYLYDALVFMYNQRRQAVQQDDPASTLFPFFMVPSGLANFWGFVQITSTPPEPGYSIAIILGGLLMLAVVASSVYFAWRGEPAAVLVLLCAVVAVRLFSTYAGFGLYKLAMFAQPFALPTLALAWCWLLRRWDRRAPWLVWALLLLAVPSIRVQKAYVGYSMDEGSSTFNEVLGATRTRVLHEFRREYKEAAEHVAPDAPMLTDAYNISLTKLIAAYTVGRHAAFPASRLTLQAAIPNAPPEHTRQSYLEQANKLSEKTSERIFEVFFEFDPAKYKPGGPHHDHDPMSNAPSARFFFYDQGGRPPSSPDQPGTLLVAGTKNISLFNRRQFGNGQGNFVMQPLSEVKNHLLFVETFRSLPYYTAGAATFISIYQLERDPLFYTTETMAGIGRYFVFEVLNPEKEIRLSIDLTMSFKSDGKNLLPNAYVVGSERKKMDFVGRGAGRLISPPIKPQILRGRAYVGIDLGEFGTQFRVARSGVANLFGKRVELDRRLLVGFGRDISTVNDVEYAKLQPPSGIRVWASPESELRNPDLEFSGVCEDGWVAEKSFFKLGQRPDESRLVLRGFVPNLGDPGFSTTLTVLVDGEPIAFAGRTMELPMIDGKAVVGPFEMEADVPPAPDGSRRRVDVVCSRVQQLQGEDQRQVAVKLDTIAFQKPSKKPARP